MSGCYGPLQINKIFKQKRERSKIERGRRFSAPSFARNWPKGCKNRVNHSITVHFVWLEPTQPQYHGSQRQGNAGDILYCLDVTALIRFISRAAFGFVKSNNVWMLRPPSRKIYEKNIWIAVVFPGSLLSTPLGFQLPCTVLSGYYGPQVKKIHLNTPMAVGESSPKPALDKKSHMGINGFAPYCLGVTALPAGKF